MQILKADTEIKVRIGPFVDVVDGFTPQTDIALSGDEAELLKHNGASTVDISGNTWAAIASCRGWYDLTLTVGNLDTEGLLTVVVQDDSDCLPVWMSFMVVNTNVYDSLYGTAATDYLKVINDAGYNIATGAMQDSLDVLLRLLLESSLMTTTTIATLDSQVSFTLNAGSSDDNAYNDCMIVIKDAETPAQKAIGFVSDYTGSSKTITLEAAPGVFTVGVGDEVFILASSWNKVVDIKKLIRADKFIDTGETPWVIDYKEEGTSTVIMSKTMKNTDGANVVTVNNVLGQLEKKV